MNFAKRDMNRYYAHNKYYISINYNAICDCWIIFLYVTKIDDSECRYNNKDSLIYLLFVTSQFFNTAHIKFKEICCSRGAKNRFTCYYLPPTSHGKIHLCVHANDV